MLVVVRLAFDPKARYVIYRRVSFHLASSNTISKFSLTSTIIPHIHQLLNPRRTTALKNCNNLGSPLPTSSPVWIPWHGCPRVMLTRGEEGRGEKILLVYSFCIVN
jgi:hypothetical protein